MGNYFQNNKKKDESEIAIEEYVDNLFENEKISSIIPDSIEQKYYSSFLVKIIRLLKNTFDNTTIEILNHLIIIKVIPKTISSE
jgi:hypothetical protein